MRNRIDGGVELIVEGSLTDVEAFLGEVALRMAANIEKVETQVEQPLGGLEGFSVKD